MTSINRFRIGLLGGALALLLGTSSPAAAAGGWAETWFDNATYTNPGSFNDQQRGYITAGGMSGRFNVHNDYLASVSLPKIKSGCGGVDMFLGGMSFLDPDFLVQKLENILQAAPAVAFQYLLETLDEKMGNIISKMEAATNYLNSIQVNDCRLAKRLVAVTGLSDSEDHGNIIEEMTGYKSIKAGFDRNYQAVHQRIESNKGNPTEDLKDAVSNCPPEVKDIFKTGSLLAHAAARVGAGAWADVMRARVGDVYMRWDATDKVPLFTSIPACPLQDQDTADDFLSGKVQTRALNIPPTNNDCADEDPGRGALVFARERMTSIAGKIRAKGALSDPEKQFLGNTRVLPLYHMLELGVRRGVEGSVIDDTDEVVATALAYQMMNDLMRSIDYAVQNAERGANSSGVVDGNDPNMCQTKILGKGLDQLRGMRDEIVRQRGQMRVAYSGALGRANLAVQYASFFRESDRDARNRDGRLAGTVR